MGFNNRGVEYVKSRLAGRKPSIVIGGNIGKNKITPNEKAIDDYMICLHELYEHVDYFVVNVSSPNTPHLRELQEKEPLMAILKALKKEISRKKVSKPLLLKIAPDLTYEQLDDIIAISNSLPLDGIVATNTTVNREGLQTSRKTLDKIGDGGLSGKPLYDRSNEIIQYLRKKLDPDIIIIGVGGIMNAEQAMEKLKSGASLIQVYTGFIYEGPGMLRKINQALLSLSNHS
jgi:dihydroorotate dehydrogenase